MTQILDNKLHPPDNHFMCTSTSIHTLFFSTHHPEVTRGGVAIPSQFALFVSLRTCRWWTRRRNSIFLTLVVLLVLEDREVEEEYVSYFHIGYNCDLKISMYGRVTDKIRCSSKLRSINFIRNSNKALMKYNAANLVSIIEFVHQVRFFFNCRKLI